MNVDHLTAEELKARALTGCTASIYRLGVITANQTHGSDAYNSTLPTFGEAISAANKEAGLVDLNIVVNAIHSTLDEKGYFYHLYGSPISNLLQVNVYHAENPIMRGGFILESHEMEYAVTIGSLEDLIKNRVLVTIRKIEEDE